MPTVRRCATVDLIGLIACSLWMVHMKKILLLLAVAGAAVFLVQRRRQAAAAEAALWDEATGKPSTAGGYPGPAR